MSESIVLLIFTLEKPFVKRFNLEKKVFFNVQYIDIIFSERHINFKMLLLTSSFEMWYIITISFTMRSFLVVGTTLNKFLGALKTLYKYVTKFRIQSPALKGFET